MVGWGPEAYDRVASVYDNPFVRLLELGLVAAVLYHSLNGRQDHADRLLPAARRRTSGPSAIATALLFVGVDDPDHVDHGSAIFDSCWKADPVATTTELAPSRHSRARSHPAAGRDRPVGGFELWTWLFMRISGIVLLFLAVGHVLIMHVFGTTAWIASTSGSSRCGGRARSGGPGTG